jgi:CDP-glucose 4,6-dehydratase
VEHRKLSVEGVALSRPSPNPGFWAKQRVLLTGHTGFKGAWAALWLERLGATVHGFALAPDQAPDMFSRLQPYRRLTSTIDDIRDPEAVRRAVAEAAPTVVLHMAAQPLVRRSYADPVATFATNVMGTVNLLDALRAAPGVAAVLVVTTDKVYRNEDGGKRFAENDPLGGHDPYSASKACTETATAAYAASFFTPAGVRLATARAGNVIGGGDWSVDRLIPDVWRALHRGEPLELRYPGATRPWQHVLDSLSGYFVYLERLASAAGAVPLTMNFGPDDATGLTVAAVAETIAGHLPGARGWIAAPGDFPVEAQALALDPARAESILGWRSRLPVHEALEWTAEWYRGFDAGIDVRRLSLDQIQRYEALA